jgi:hypothetical protein
MTVQQDFNPHLKEWEKRIPTSDPGAGSIEHPGQFRNSVWQTRSRVPNDHERRLVQALEQAFANGALELSDVVAQLNQAGVHDHSGKEWNDASFREAMATLGY